MNHGDALGREYLLHEEIGRGALAVVRRATSRFGGPPLAAKLFEPGLAGDRRVRELFIREEAALRDLDHPGIVGIRDLVVEGGRLALLMDLVDGPDLRRHLAGRGGRLPGAEAAAIGAQAAAALAAAHAQGVVHLDLKPENILLVRGSEPPVVRITDFGVAALLHDADPAVLGGTPGYEAPELRGGGPATAAADVWSLGVVLREIQDGTALDGVIADCLAPDPRARPSARSVAIRLRESASPAPASSAPGRRDTRLRHGGAPRTPVPAPPEPKPLHRRRGPLLTLAAGVVVAAVAVLVTMNAAAGPGATVRPLVAASSAAPVQAPGSLPPTDTVAQRAPAERTRATYAGRLPGDRGTLAIAVRDGAAVAYLCDGERAEAWLRGTMSGGALSLTGERGATLKGAIDTRRARGDVTAAGVTARFDIAAVAKPSGIYRAAARVSDAQIRGSWIVLPDGSQVGVLVDGGVPGPAPALDVTTGTTTVDGTEVATSTIDADSGEGF
ncbi:serine/threonine-protein kinase [Actinoplanes sp. RD1]|uniref:serine/threonine-protein kinase n=1 Tax=Actinoplanes sp. RD1 TaxID=3064538 RepID=UPI0027418B04|nr:serine/threonine-protein kinase [Actinoplanes sp. RD1]